ncbi:MAG: pyridoxal phosphate-dependent aminotransferase [Candidatus Aminicenantes bacterium]
MNTLSKRVLENPPSATVLIADIAAGMRRQGIDIIDFSAGRAAEHSPYYVNQEAAQALLSGDTHQTMAQGKPEYREACARKLARENGIVADPEKSIIATLGCKQGLTLALMAVVDPGDEVIIEDPCFVSYQPTIRFCGGIPVPVPLRRENYFRWQRNELEAAITDRTKAILFCSPHNPTGTVHTEADLDLISEIARKHDLTVISDEIYERVTWGDRRHICIATRPHMKERSITLMGLTKTFSMGGWRIGFIYAPESIISGMVTLQQHLMTCAGSFTQTGAAKALSEEPPSEIKELWKDWERRCQFVVSELNSILNISCDPPEGGFYAWIDITGTGETSEQLAERLLREYHIALVPGPAFGATGEGYLRMTCVRSWDDLREGLLRFKKALPKVV